TYSCTPLKKSSSPKVCRSMCRIDDPLLYGLGPFLKHSHGCTYALLHIPTSMGASPLSLSMTAANCPSMYFWYASAPSLCSNHKALMYVAKPSFSHVCSHEL